MLIFAICFVFYSGMCIFVVEERVNFPFFNQNITIVLRRIVGFVAKSLYFN